VDFTADWCLTCKSNLKFAINTAEVKELVEQNEVVPLLADWTDKNDTIKQALSELDSRSIPLLAIYPADPEREVIVLRDVVSQSTVLEALAEAGPSMSENVAVNEDQSSSGAPLGPEFGAIVPGNTTTR
ncbi:MAG TPA: thioredoxin family protein, partial [Lacipirellula sp.]